MIRALVFAAPLALLACAPTQNAPGGGGLAVDQAGAARAAQSAPDLVAVASALNARQGAMLTPELSITSASAENGRLAMRFKHNERASAFGPAAREGYEIVAVRDIRSGLCGAPATARFVETYGVSADIVTADEQPLATVTVDDC